MTTKKSKRTSPDDETNTPATPVPSPESSGSDDPDAPEVRIKDLVKPHRKLIVEKLLDVLNTGTHSNKIRAAEILAGYSDGKPKQETETMHILTYQDFLGQIAQREEKFIAVKEPDAIDVEAIPQTITPADPWGDVL